MTEHSLRCLRAAASAIVAAAVLAAPVAARAADDGASWQVIGRQGIVQLVLVPASQAADRPAYDREIERLCAAGQTCFLNFYTNTAGAAVSVPLPDAIAQQATATFRRSTKQGAEMFQWSCRLKMAVDTCF